MKVTREGELLVARLDGMHRVASWAVVGGGLGRAQAVVWLRVGDADLGPEHEPTTLLQDRLRAADLNGAVGLLTAANLDRFEEATARRGDVEARAVVTVGLSNALRVGDRPRGFSVGTINLLVTVSVPLSEEALLEAMSLATEARTVAVVEGGIRSSESGSVASGTGTDCVVVAAPEIGEPRRYAGKHTDVGHVVGASVLEATARGVAVWKARWSR